MFIADNFYRPANSLSLSSKVGKKVITLPIIILRVTVNVACKRKKCWKAKRGESKGRGKTKFVLFQIIHLFIALVYRAWERFSKRGEGITR